METGVWDVPLKFRFRGVSENPPVTFSFPCFWTGPLCLCWLDTYLEQFTTDSGEIRTTRKIRSPLRFMCIQNTFYDRRTCRGCWFERRKMISAKPKVNYLISEFVSKFLASGLSLFGIVFYIFVVPVKIAISYFAPPSPNFGSVESELTGWFNQVEPFRTHHKFNHALNVQRLSFQE